MKIAVLTQTQYISNPLIERHKKLFNTDISDYHRLNWKQTNDKDALVCRKNICWSEGRSLLYEEAKKVCEYDYYIFIDDDVDFIESDDRLIYKIRDLFQEFAPLSGCFNGQTKHSNGREWHLSSVTTSQKVFPVCAFDLNVHYFHKSFAELVFPVIYHGSGKIMWYAMFLCHKLFPGKQCVFSQIKTKNTRHEENEDHDLAQFNKPDAAMDMFAKNLLTEELRQEFNRWKQHSNIMTMNSKISHSSVSKDKIFSTINDISKIYDVTNSDYINRRSIE